MMATEDPAPKPGEASGSAEGRVLRLLKAPWRRLVTAEDLYPPALLAFFVLLPPPLGSLAWALLGVLTIVIVLQVWRRYRRGTADAG